MSILHHYGDSLQMIKIRNPELISVVGTISGVSPIGSCQVEQINRNQVSITPGNEEGMDFGISIEFLPDPEIAISGGELSLD